MALPPSTANWHWRSKDVSPWARSWFESQLVNAVIFEEGSTTAKIDALTTFEGDAEVGMRKSKLLTIYDVKLEYSWSGTASDGSSASGTINLPEVSHDVGADGDGDYQFETTLSGSPTAETRQLLDLVRRNLETFLPSKLNAFPAAMLEAHGKDLKVEGTPSVSGAVTPVGGGPANSTLSAADTSAKLKAVKETKPVKATNTAVVKVEATFAASASDLFEMLTNEAKIGMWSRAAAKSTPTPDSEYSIFGGNIYGKYITLEQPKKIVQTWILKSPSWPDNHAGTMTTTLDQGSDSTKVTFELAGVPTGQEDEIRNNINGYYVRGFQSIGYVQLTSEPSPSLPSSSSQKVSSKREEPKPAQPLASWVIVLSLITSVVVAAVGTRYLK